MPPAIKNHQKCPTKALSPMTIRLGNGTEPPSPTRRFALIGTKNLQTVPQWPAGRNHDGGLAEEHRNFLDLDFAAAKSGQGEFLALLPDGARRDPLLTEL